MSNKINQSQNTSSVSYKGTVEVSYFKNKKCIRKQKFNNNGTAVLFSFLVNALAGNFSEISGKRPLYIMCANNEKEVEEALENLFVDSNITIIGGLTKMSKTPTLRQDTSKKESAITFTWDIPKVYLTAYSDDSSSINQIFLVGEDVKFDDLNGISSNSGGNVLATKTMASTLFYKNNASTYEYNGINLKSLDENVTVQITWTLTFKNN